MKGKVSRSELAAALGVSGQTVGIAFGGIGYISKQLKSDVLKKASEMGYQPAHHLIGTKRKSKWRELIPEIRQLKHRGLSYEKIGEMYGVSRQMIQQLLKVKRGEMCEHCGETEKRLDGHHVDYLTDESVTLCMSCHRRLHTTVLADNPPQQSVFNPA